MFGFIKKKAKQVTDKSKEKAASMFLKNMVNDKMINQMMDQMGVKDPKELIARMKAELNNPNTAIPKEYQSQLKMLLPMLETNANKK